VSKAAPRALAATADEIEAEMKKLGWWERERPPAEAFEFELEYAADTMGLYQWMQWVLVPTLREGRMPRERAIGLRASHELEGLPEGGGLMRVLNGLENRPGADKPSAAEPEPDPVEPDAPRAISRGDFLRRAAGRLPFP